MKLKNLDQVKDLTNGLQRVSYSYENNLKTGKNKLRLIILLDNGRNADSVPSEFLDLDLSMDGPIAALVDQAYRRKIAELEKELQLLGVDLEDE